MNDLFEPEITLLYCGRSLTPGDYLSEGTKKGNGFKVRFVMVPCSSKVEVGHLIKLIEQGADGVMLVVCPKEQCQFMLGSTRAYNRVKYARTLLEEVGMNPDILAIVQGNDLSAERFMALAGDRANAIKNLGRNPAR